MALALALALNGWLRLLLCLVSLHIHFRDAGS